MAKYVIIILQILSIGTFLLGFWLSIVATEAITLTFYIYGLFAVLSIVVLVLIFKKVHRCLFVVPVVSFVGLLTICIYGWPLQLLFDHHRAAFDQLANDVLSGTNMDFPVRIGIYELQDYELRAGSIFFWTEKSAAGNLGFIHASPEVLFDEYNAWSVRSLGADWHLLAED